VSANHILQNGPFFRKRYQFPVRNTKWLKNGKLRRAILSAFYNISQRNFEILLILRCSFKLWWNFCLDLSRSKFCSLGNRSIASLPTVVFGRTILPYTLIIYHHIWDIIFRYKQFRQKPRPHLFQVVQLLLIAYSYFGMLRLLICLRYWLSWYHALDTIQNINFANCFQEYSDNLAHTKPTGNKNLTNSSTSKQPGKIQGTILKPWL
jgi:hypothetical protein